MARAVVLACASFVLTCASFVLTCAAFVLAFAAFVIEGPFPASTARAQDSSEGGAASAYGDGVAAIVGAAVPRPDAIVLLHSDVDFRARLRLTRELGGRVPRGPVPPELLRASLDELVGEALIAREARRVQVGIPGAAALREERRALESLAGGVEAFSALMVALGVTEMEIATMVERRAMVRLFLDANLRGGTQIEDSEVVALYESGEHPFLGQELDEVREPLRAILRRRRIENAVARWIEVLRGRTVVRFVAPYAS